MALPTIKTREDLIHALSQAAELEHGIICQYLFAAFSLKSHIDEGKVTWAQLECVREWKSAILLMARQEMEHLGLVGNLLMSIGGTPHFRRPNFPHPTLYCPPYPTFELQPFCEATLQRFTCFEQLHRLAGDNRKPPVPDQGETVGMLYESIKQGFEGVSETLQRDQSGVLFIGPREAQIVNQHLGLPQGHFDVDLLAVHDLQSAVRAIDHIIEAGAATTPHDTVSHSERFEQILDELKHMQRRHPDFEPARPVAPNPVTRASHLTMSGMTPVTHPVTLQAVRLFNLAYETMMLMLTRFYAYVEDTPTEREGLMKTAFFPMMTAVIRPLGEMLTHMPVHDDESGETAGPAFEFEADLPLPPFRRSAWTFLYERLQTIATSCGDVCRQIEHARTPWAEKVQPRLSFMRENLERMVSNFEHSMHLRREYVELLLRRLL
jgi:Ferritin-like